MDGNDGELQEPPSVSRVADVTEKQERSMYSGYGGAHPKNPNSLFVPLGKIGHLSWQSESGTPVLALIMLAGILVCLVVVGIISLFAHTGGSATAAGALGQALLAIVGAVIGASSQDRR